MVSGRNGVSWQAVDRSVPRGLVIAAHIQARKKGRCTGPPGTAPLRGKAGLAHLGAPARIA